MEPNPLVFPYCWKCGMSPAYHHGRCCPARVIDRLAAPSRQVVTLIKINDPWKSDVNCFMNAPAATMEPSPVGTVHQGPIPGGQGDGPLRSLEMDRKRQHKREKRMEYISKLIQEEKRDSSWLLKEVSENPEELNFPKEVKLAKIDRNKKKQEMLTTMLQDTTKDNAKSYADNPQEEVDLEFDMAWNVGGGLEYDTKVNEEWKRHSARLAKALDTDNIWKGCAAAGPATTSMEDVEQTWDDATYIRVEEPLAATPPPNASTL